jgi:hypothetical protein
LCIMRLARELQESSSGRVFWAGGAAAEIQNP